MDLQDSYNYLLFWINKYAGSWYAPPELDTIVDKGQLLYYKDCFKIYGTGQRLNDALAPFKIKIPFTTDSSGNLATPDDYMDLIAIQCIVGGKPYPCPVVNDDEITGRLNSQIIPNSVTAPFAEETANWDYILYPNNVVQSGILTYFRRPKAPVFKCTTVSGRVIVYDSVNSTQLEWGDDEVIPVLIKTLSSIGINLSSQDILQYAEMKDKENFLSTMRQQ